MLLCLEGVSLLTDSLTSGRTLGPQASPLKADLSSQKGERFYTARGAQNPLGQQHQNPLGEIK